MPVDPDELLRRQMGEFLTAAGHYRDRNGAGVATALANPDDPRPDREIYADSVSMTVVAALLVGHEVGKSLGHPLGSLPPDLEIVAEDVAPQFEQSATDRFAWSLVLDVLNNRWDSITARVNVYATPDEAGMKRVVLLTMAMLSLYVQIADSNMAEAS
jgi:hypothetical protein